MSLDIGTCFLWPKCSGLPLYGCRQEAGGRRLLSRRSQAKTATLATATLASLLVTSSATATPDCCFPKTVCPVICLAAIMFFAVAVIAVASKNKTVIIYCLPWMQPSIALRSFLKIWKKNKNKKIQPIFTKIVHGVPTQGTHHLCVKMMILW